MRDLVRRALEDSFDIVGELGDGRACADVVRQCAVEVVVMDCHMPFPGDAATEQVKTWSPGVTVVGFTGGPDTQRRMLRAGADAVFDKLDLQGLVDFLGSS